MGYIAREKEINLLYAESERMYRRFVEDLRMGVYMADGLGNLFYVNNAFVRILGYENREEVLGLNLAQQLYLNPEDRKEFLHKMEKTGFVQDYVVKNKRKDGSIAVLSVTSNYIRNAKEEVIGVEGVVDDITEKKRLEDEVKILSGAIGQTADHVMITDIDGVIHYVNPAFEKTTGYTAAEIIGKTPRILKSGKHGKDYYERLWTTILSGEIFYAQTTNRKKNGEFYIADQTISPLRSESGGVTHFVSIWKDITEKVKLAECLKAEKRKLEEIIGFDEKISSIRKSEKLTDFAVAKTMKILQAKKCSIMLIDKETETLCMKGSSGLDDPLKIKDDHFMAAKVIQDGRPHMTNDMMIAPIKREGKVIGVIHVADKCNPLSPGDVFNDSDIRILGAIAREMAVAIENINFYKELHYLTITDPMTSIYNFRHFARCVEYEIKRINRIPGELGLLMLDVDDFKLYNDQFGHPSGDQLLRDVGQAIQENLRELDILCRYAGDEFAVILPGTDKNGSAVLAERVRKSIEQTKFKKPMTVSIGVAQYKNPMTRHELTARADRALYEAKKEGKNKVYILG